MKTAKANSYTEVERKRGREKYNRLYKGKKKAKEQPYTIEGKTIKQLVEENLGVMIKTNLDHNYFLCGYEPSTTEKDIDPIMASDKKQIKIIKSDIFPNDPNTIFSWCSYEQLILAIKRHRNIK